MANGMKKEKMSAAEKVRKDVSSVFTMMEQEAPMMGKEAPIKVKTPPKKKGM